MLPASRKRNYDFLDNFFDNLWLEEGNVNTYFPKVDIKEDENNIIVEADLPGLDKKDINVHVENNTLSISGSREVKKEEKEKGWHRSERQYGKFERSFYLGENVDSQKIKAEFDKGVLKISVPKKEEAKPKAIDIAVK